MNRFLVTFIFVFCISSAPAFSKDSVSRPFRIYLSPTGSDYNGGLTPRKAIKSLNRAQNILKNHIGIHIRSGTYNGQEVTWRYTNGHTITYTAHGFSKNRPFFDGKGVGHTWFTYLNDSDRKAALFFKYIKV